MRPPLGPAGAAPPERDLREWLEPDGLGGFASGTVSGLRTRRYHALLLAALEPPTKRVVLVNGLEAWVETKAGRYPLSRNEYAPGVIHPDGPGAAFERDPWPRWTFQLPDGMTLTHELFAVHGTPAVALSWKASGPARLFARPLLSGRDYHSSHHENPAFRFDAEEGPGRVSWQPYQGLSIHARFNGAYKHQPDWFRQFLLREEQARGLDHLEDLASPGVMSWELGEREAVLLLCTGPMDGDALGRFQSLREAERARRAGFESPLHRAADAYLVKRGQGRTIVAGYPWFTDWGRDTFISLRGLFCTTAAGREQARRILLEWAGAVSEGMIPNLFGDQGAAEYNSVDASLWFVVAVSEAAPEDPVLREAVEQILDGYSRGTRFSIRCDSDGLLAAGEPGVALTWMDARHQGEVFTPRIGKPVEVQALWINALGLGGPRWKALHDRARAAFAERFWNDARQCLHDVVDEDHQPGRVDSKVRPNQILAVGGLPEALLDGARARAVVDAVERALWTPLGLRTLAPEEPGYKGRYQGGPRERDGAYHQGTAWPWLLGPFVEAWLRVRGNTQAACSEASARFVQPLRDHLESAGLGHVSEIADGDAPHTPCGCPFQAWSLGALLRLEALPRLQALPRL